MVNTIDVEEKSSEKNHRHSTSRTFCIEVVVPVHITGIWLPIISSSPLESGSLGAGLLLSPEVHIVVRVSKGSGSCSGVCIPPVNYICTRESINVVVEIKKGPEIGAGYAVSAALSLSAGIASTLFRGRSIEEGAQLAHVAEVISGTGLGDVIAQYMGRGLVLRIAPGAPGIGRVRSYPVPSTPVITITLGRMSTSEMHKLLGEKLYSEAAKRLKHVFEAPSLEVFLEQASKFSISVGMASNKVVEWCNSLFKKNRIVGWYAKKRVLVIVVEKDYYNDVVDEAKSVFKRDPYIFVPAVKPLEVRLCSPNP